MPSTKIFRRAAVALLIIPMLLCGCSSQPKRYVSSGAEEGFSEPITLEELLSLELVEATEEEQQSVVRGLRIKTIRETAYALGTQGGLAWRTYQLNEKVEANSSLNDRIFNFAPFLIDGKILSPSILEAERIYHQVNEIRARTVSVSYVLAKPARIVPMPPTWREYLLRPVLNPELPNPQLFPRTAHEKEVWRDQILSGWQAGIEQADQIFEIDLRRLERDYTGMQRFRMLVKQGIVSMPELSVGNFGIVKDGKTLNVNDVVYEITTSADFNDADKWRPVFR